jgi:hypothetical protein
MVMANKDVVAPTGVTVCAVITTGGFRRHIRVSESN